MGEFPDGVRAPGRMTFVRDIFSALGSTMIVLMTLGLVFFVAYIVASVSAREFVSEHIDPVLRFAGEAAFGFAAGIAQVIGGTSATSVWNLLMWGATLIGLGLVVWRLSRTKLAQQLNEQVGGSVLSNWRLVLLGLTGIALSVASGWTTWDGMTNFTGNPLLSLLITFGIQGVMLIAAWLIGESFAVGLSSGKQQVRPNFASRAASTLFWFVAVSGIVLTTVYFGRDVVAIITSQDPLRAARAFLLTLDNQGNQMRLWASLGAFVLTLIVLGALASGEVIGPYFRGAKIITRNLPIWLMFASCMATSVFFSFDSLFSKIFPPQERVRAAELRTQNRIAGLVSDVGAQLQLRRQEEIDRLFRDEPWRRYEGQLTLLLAEARRAPQLIEAEFRRRIEDENKRRAGFEEQATTAEARIASLDAEKQRLLARISSLDGDQPALRAAIGGINEKIGALVDQIITKKTEVEAEAAGVSARSGSGRAGRGPLYREKLNELRNLEFERKALEDERDQQRKRLDGLVEQQREMRRELEAAEAQIAQLRGEAQTARQSLAFEETRAKDVSGPKLDTSGGFLNLERQLALFRQQPTDENFGALQGYCGVLLTTLQTVPQLKPKVADINCEPESASNAVAPVLTLNDAVANYQQYCGEGEKMPQTGGTDALLAFGARCVQDSGLAGEDTEIFRAALNRLALSRDDKAHRFVVTWNAFQDGNQLAYLALAIAIAIDALVFMSGLFGANVTKSPLASSPGATGRSADQLDQILEGALLPDISHNAEIALGAIHPIRREWRDRAPGFTHEVALANVPEEQKFVVKTVLNAASILELVDSPETGMAYVRPELYEALLVLRRKHFRMAGAARPVARTVQPTVAAPLRRQALIEGPAPQAAEVEMADAAYGEDIAPSDVTIPLETAPATVPAMTTAPITFPEIVRNILREEYSQEVPIGAVRVIENRRASYSNAIQALRDVDDEINNACRSEQEEIRQLDLAIFLPQDADIEGDTSLDHESLAELLRVVRHLIRIRRVFSLQFKQLTEIADDHVAGHAEIDEKTLLDLAVRGLTRLFDNGASNFKERPIPELLNDVAEFKSSRDDSTGSNITSIAVRRSQT